MELVKRQCHNVRCSLTFKVLPHDKQKYCSKDCEWNAENVKGTERSRFQHHALVQSVLPNPAMQKAMQETSVVMPRFGATVRGEAPKVQLKEKPYDVKPTLDASDIETMRKDEGTKKTRLTEKKCSLKAAGTTTKTETKPLPAERSGGEITVKDKTKPTEAATSESKSPSDQKSTPTVLSETPSTDLAPFSGALETERSSSMKQLNDASAQLLELAKSLAPKATVENSGPLNSVTLNENRKIAIQAIGEFRNIMKTKLDFLKFGKELYDEKRP